MNILIIGSGGREHALAWKIAQSSKLTKLFILPGNGGTGSLGENVTGLSMDDHPALIRFCEKKKIDLVIVGPEAPLADGVADVLIGAGIRCFGPRKAAAQIEASKSFAKEFMARRHIPTARFQTFTKYEDALQHVKSVEYPIVIKASGLSSGKGVVLPEDFEEAEETLRAMLVRHEFKSAGKEVVIEERLEGPEVSLMAFTDGKTIVPMLPAQDHKRLLDGDQGPNTGGMGAYAPAPVCTPEMSELIKRTILQPVIDGMREEGYSFVGVLFAGLILTADGPKVLEFNCRFGDPETQTVMTLLDSDLIDVITACVDGSLDKTKVHWKSGASVCVVLASGGYPGKLIYGKLTKGSRSKIEDGVCFHAGTRFEGGRIITAGGRVFGVTAWDESIEKAIARAYSAVEKISFEGMQYRKDIAWRALQPELSYASSGVSIDAGNRAVDLMKSAVEATYTPAVLAGIGSFGGLFDATSLQKMKHPVIVASTDGVGTKVKLAAQAGRFRGIGQDIVNHCINDILVQGARPMFFMDYFATSKLNPQQTADVVKGVADACREAGMALLGGETAEMPDVYRPGEFDVAGTIVGVIERDDILPRPNMRAGDVLIGLASSGPHTNGYSLIRKVFADTPLESMIPELGCSLADALLAPHRSYLNVISNALRNPHIHALAHLTGGGFIENIPRVLPDDLDAVIRLNSWTVPPLWKLIQQKGNIAAEEMYHVFNMGIGMVMIVDKAAVAKVQKMIREETFVIGELVKGERKSRLVV